MPDWPEVGLRILTARRRRLLTQQDAARLARISRRQWSQLENGRLPHVSVQVLARVAPVLGVTMEFLLHGPPADSGSACC